MIENKTCETCMYYVSTMVWRDQEVYQCELTNRIIVNPEKCDMRDVSIRDAYVCYNCQHFIGNNGDWGLCCRKDYYKLPTALDRACDDFERKYDS